MGVRFWDSSGGGTVAIYSSGVSPPAMPVMMHCKFNPKSIGAGAGDRCIMGFFDTIGGHYMAIFQNTSHVFARSKSSTTQTATTAVGSVHTLGEWYSVTAIFVGTSQREIYVTDDTGTTVSATNTNSQGAHNAFQMAAIGARATSGTPTFGDPFRGSLADVCFWNNTENLAKWQDSLHHCESRGVVAWQLLQYQFPMFSKQTGWDWDQIGNTQWTVSGPANNPTVVPSHPPMSFNRRRSARYVPSVAAAVDEAQHASMMMAHF